MAELKKTQFSNVNDEIISMEFDNNPNIPTANYSEETAIKIQETIKKKMRAEKLKKMIEFINDIGNYENRKLGKTEVNGVTVSTA